MAKINTTFSYQDGITQGLNRLIKTLKGVEQTLKGTENGLKGANDAITKEAEATIKAEKAITSTAKATKKANTEIEKTAKATKTAQGGLSALSEKLLKFNLIVSSLNIVKGAVNGVTGAVGGLNAMWQEQQNAEARLGAVMEARMGATKAGIADMTSYLDTFSKGSAYSKTMLTNAAQELGTYVEKADTLKGLLPMLTSMAQQAGVTNEQGLMSMATMIGKVMGGAMGGLSDRGWVFSAEEKEAFKAMNETERLNFLTKTAAENFNDMDSAITAMMANLAQQKHLEDLQIKLGGLFNSFFDAVGRAQIAIQTEFLERIVPIVERISPVFDQMVVWVTNSTAAIHSAIDTLVERISPVFDQMVVWVTNSTAAIHSAIDTLVERVQNAKMRIQNAIEGYRIAEIIVPMIDEIREKFGSLASAVQSALSGAFEKAVHTVVNIIKTIRQVYDGFYNVMDGIRENLNDIAIAITAAGTIIIASLIAVGAAYLWTSRVAIAGYITHLRRGIVIALMHAKIAVASAIKTAMAWAAANAPLLIAIGIIIALIAAIALILAQSEKTFPVIAGFFSGIGEAAKAVGNNIRYYFLTAIEKVVQGFQKLKSKIADIFLGIVDKVLSAALKIAPIVDKAFPDFSERVSGMKATINELRDASYTPFTFADKGEAWNIGAHWRIGVENGKLAGADASDKFQSWLNDKLAWVKNLIPQKKGTEDLDGVDKEGKSVEDMIKDALDDKFQTDGTGALKTSDKSVIEISADYKELLTSAATRRFNATFKNVAPSVSVGTVVMNNGADKDEFISDLETALKNVAENDLAS